jgi:hypothetical protein
MSITDSVKNRKVVKPIVRYSWIRAGAGYEWISVNVSQQEFIEGNKHIRPKPESDFLLVEADRSGLTQEELKAGVTRPEYRFYETPADLFNEFASTEETKEAVKAFADKWGQLGFEKGNGRTSFADDSVSGHDWSGELLSWWCGAIAKMRNATALWEAIEEARNGDDSGLSRFVRWTFVDGDARAGVSIPGRRRWWFGRELQNLKMRADSNEKTHGRWTRGDLISPANEFLRAELIKNLTGSLSIGLDWNEAHSDLVRSFRPNSLLALLWLQFADAITGDTEFRHCKRCGKLIRISPEHGSHTNKQTCSDSCKVQVYQERVRTVIASFDQGKTPDEIAISSETELSMVRKWIARELGKRGDTVATISSRLSVKPREVRKLLEKKAAARDSS